MSLFNSVLTVASQVVYQLVRFRIFRIYFCCRRVNYYSTKAYH